MEAAPLRSMHCPGLMRIFMCSLCSLKLIRNNFKKCAPSTLHSNFRPVKSWNPKPPKPEIESPRIHMLRHLYITIPQHILAKNTVSSFYPPPSKHGTPANAAGKLLASLEEASRICFQASCVLALEPGNNLLGRDDHLRAASRERRRQTDRPTN